MTEWQLSLFWYWYYCFVCDRPRDYRSEAGRRINTDFLREGRRSEDGWADGREGVGEWGELVG